MIQLPWRKLLAPKSGKRLGDGSLDEERASAPDHGPSGQSGTAGASAVRGERAAFIVSGARSLQSRMSSLLAAGLMISVGTGMLAWYYLDALSRPAAARTPSHASLPDTAGEGMTLPPFEPTASLPPVRPAASVPSALSTASGFASGSSTGGQSMPAAASPLVSLLEPPLNRASGVSPASYGALPQPSARQRALDRRLSGEVFSSGGRGISSNVAAGGGSGGYVAAVPFGEGQAQPGASGPEADALGTLLRPSVLSVTRAQILPTQRLLLPQGTFIDCTLETAIDSTLPGMTTCVTATDTFGADGTVVLLERGTKLIGETRGEVHQGDARVFVVWMQARTPAGVVVQLDSPGTDALGRSGLEGKVNRHFWQRFGAAALVSTISGAVQSEVQSSSRGGTVVLDPTASEDVLTEVLRGTVNIPPTIRVRNGARIQVLVARDIDFRRVYELEPR